MYEQVVPKKVHLRKVCGNLNITVYDCYFPASRFQKKEKKKQMKPMINMNNFKVWRADDKNCPEFTREFQIAKFAVFKAHVSVCLL